MKKRKQRKHSFSSSMMLNPSLESIANGNAVNPHYAGTSSLPGNSPLLRLMAFGLIQVQDRTKTTLDFASRLKTLLVTMLLVLIARRVVGSSGNKKSINRVAVIGGGIAGMGAAWSLKRAGKQVALFEKKPKLGGNAKSYTWDVGGKKVETGLAVLAYPHRFFHTYVELMKAAGMEEGTMHELKYFVAEKNYRGPGKPADGSDVECVFAHGKHDFKPAPWLVQDLKGWESLVAFVTRVNAWFCPCDYKSLYRMSLWNPLNLISLRQLCRMYSISDYFWERVFVPVHTSTFLEVEMDEIPAVMAELLNDMVPLSGKTPEMKAWTTNAYDIFTKLTQGWSKDEVRTSCAVEKVQFVPQADGTYRVFVTHEDTPADQPGEEFDAVVFACPAPQAEQMIDRTQPTFGMKERFLTWLENYLLRSVLYTVERDQTFTQGICHGDGSVFPAKFREELLDHHCNYMVVDGNKPNNVENHFIISSWAPTAHHVKHERAMLVSYNCPQAENVEAEWTVTSKEAHPCLTIKQSTFIITLWPILQGFRNNQQFYCGSAFTPGNGHDLSLLSGFVAASQLGADYPFPHSKEGMEDFQRLRGIMLGMWA